MHRDWRSLVTLVLSLCVLLLCRWLRLSRRSSLSESGLRVGVGSAECRFEDLEFRAPSLRAAPPPPRRFQDQEDPRTEGGPQHNATSHDTPPAHAQRPKRMPNHPQNPRNRRGPQPPLLAPRKPPLSGAVPAGLQHRPQPQPLRKETSPLRYAQPVLKGFDIRSILNCC